MSIIKEVKEHERETEEATPSMESPQLTVSVLKDLIEYFNRVADACGSAFQHDVEGRLLHAHEQKCYLFGRTVSQAQGRLYSWYSQEEIRAFRSLMDHEDAKHQACEEMRKAGFEAVRSLTKQIGEHRKVSGDLEAFLKEEQSLLQLKERFRSVWNLSAISVDWIV